MKIIFCHTLSIFLLISGVFSCAYGQEQIVDEESIKTLFKQFNDEKDPDKKVTIGLEIALKHISFNPDTVIKYGEEALKLARQNGDKRSQIAALGFIGEANIYKGNLPRTLQLGLEAIELHEGLKPDRDYTGPTIGPTYFNLVELYIQLQDYDKALEYSRTKIELGKFEDGDGKEGITTAFAYYLIAKTYEKTNQLDSALVYVDKALNAFQNVRQILFGDVYEVYPKLYNVQASIYFKQNEPQKALNKLRKGLAVTTASGESLHSSEFNNDLAAYFQAQQQADSAIYYATRGLEEAQKIGYAQAMLTSNQILAAEYESIDSEKALAYYKKATIAQNELYGSGNMQVIKDIIAENEKRSIELQQAEKNYRNRLLMFILLAGLLTLALFLFFQYRSNKKSKAANTILSNTLSDLKSTQAQLIQSEKMASLGELTAGIAHEIQNPLNFVNNFSEVSEELVKEMKEERLKAKDDRDEALEDEILYDLEQNLVKINHHGHRASSIVKGMLEHSRTSSGKKELTDINALADEYLRLSYHGLRAKDRSFNADFKTDFDAELPKIKVIPQDIGRVLLNLINNAFQAVDEKAKSGIVDYKPSVSISTELKAKSHVEITVTDNGFGIPEAIKDKIFQPFFTTKETGKGTGLGLSLAYDIVKAHGGELNVKSKVDKGTEFIIMLQTH